MSNGTQEVNPASAAQAITLSDSVVYPNAFRAFYVGTTGDVNVVTADGQTVVFTAVPAGAIIPVRVKTFKSTSTTASNIVGLR